MEKRIEKYINGKRYTKLSQIKEIDNDAYFGIVEPEKVVTYDERCKIEKDEKYRNLDTRVSVSIWVKCRDIDYNLVWYGSSDSLNYKNPEIKRNTTSGGRIKISQSDIEPDLSNSLIVSKINEKKRNEIFKEHLIRELDEEIQILHKNKYIGLGSFIKNDIIGPVSMKQQETTISNIVFKMKLPIIYNDNPDNFLQLLKVDVSEAITVGLQKINKKTNYLL